MRSYQSPRFNHLVMLLLNDFVTGTAQAVDVGQWHSQDVKGDASKVTWELREAVLVTGMPDSIEGAQFTFSPNLPWAEDHFLERVGGQPLNPPPSNEWWPFAQAGNEVHKDRSKFSHTYPERFWALHAGHPTTDCPYAAEVEEGREMGYYSRFWPCGSGPSVGVRFRYGDLNDVVARLKTNLLTRQAYLPIWFPEDTGAPDGVRVPCSLGYHFMVREGKLHLTYHIRSCDFMRHFRDDVYMAVRLAQWVWQQLGEDYNHLRMGELTMHIGSFHIFEGDRVVARRLLEEAMGKNNSELLRRMA